ncbi:Mediator of DNA damage checkpoint protein 1 [Wickerhamomyces ciferrii]|uniref:Mediator of DNA damage checkpoint protein 1 n=1 Tax=Wickerhamomyces ciferrii (strain ATCC 14091 / BCRC 22168 / CBS 111 / JCM 3599 / NBRC 0793 / NRRL Y-1031 F-60-10) TaxID=1206466 RepID=K0KLR3_WICCF|nr:Mediator of DNA damage checkpoint protein 1 [Wickerhamomyces ciferrii]CCH43931.1 Mediator of DNA damage checkpoint protein 1 [Wickerhamomyces ciferrii]
MSDSGREETPSLIGGSVISGQDQESTPISSSRSPSKSNVKKENSHNKDYTSVSELNDEGVLLQDDKEYDDLLDETGKLKPSVSQTSTPTTEKPKKKTKAKRKPPAAEPKESTGERPQDAEISLEDLIDSQIASISELSIDFQKRISDKKSKPRALNSSRSRSNKRNSKVPESVIENDSLHQVPAGAPEGSDSPLIQSRSTSTAPKEKKKSTKTSAERPNLAGGESYKGISSEYRPGRKAARDDKEDVSSPLAHTSEDYLRSVSTSRSRVADHQPDNNELYDEGALLHDPEHKHELDVARDDAIDKLTEKPTKATAVTDVTKDDVQEQKEEPKLPVSKDKKNVDDAKERLRKLSQNMQNKSRKSSGKGPVSGSSEGSKKATEPVQDPKSTESNKKPTDSVEDVEPEIKSIVKDEKVDADADEDYDFDDSVVIVDERTIPSQKSLEDLSKTSAKPKSKSKSKAKSKSNSKSENAEPKDSHKTSTAEAESDKEVKQSVEAKDTIDETAEKDIKVEEPVVSKDEDLLEAKTEPEQSSNESVTDPAIVPEIEDLKIEDVKSKDHKATSDFEKDDESKVSKDLNTEKHQKDTKPVEVEEKDLASEKSTTEKEPSSDVDSTSKASASTEKQELTNESPVEKKTSESESSPSSKDVKKEDSKSKTEESKTVETQTGDETEVPKDVATVADVKPVEKHSDVSQNDKDSEPSELIKNDVVEKEAEEAKKDDVKAADIKTPESIDNETTLDQQLETVEALDANINKTAKAEDAEGLKATKEIEDNDGSDEAQGPSVTESVKEEATKGGDNETIETASAEKSLSKDDSESVKDDPEVKSKVESESETLSKDAPGKIQKESTAKEEIEQELKDITKDTKATLPDVSTSKEADSEDTNLTGDTDNTGVSSKEKALKDSNTTLEIKDKKTEKNDNKDEEKDEVEDNAPKSETTKESDDNKPADEVHDDDDDKADESHEADVSAIESISRGVKDLNLEPKFKETEDDIKVKDQKSEPESLNVTAEENSESIKEPEVPKVADPASEAERLIKELEDAIEGDISTDSIIKDEPESSTNVEKDVEKVSKDIIPESKQESDVKAKDLGHIIENDKATSEVNVIQDDPPKEVKPDTPITKEVEPETPKIETKPEVPSDDIDIDHEPTKEEIMELLKDEPVYLYTSLAGGGFHMPHRTNRLATILTGNQIPFTYRDLGTDEEARNVWRRYSRGRLLPAVVRGKDDIIGNFQEIDEANEEYRVRELIYETL